MKLEAVIAARLKEAREASGMSQQALGVAVGIEEETAKVRVHQYENAKHAPPFPMLERLARVLNKPLGWFLCEPDEQGLLVKLNELQGSTRAAMIQAIEQLLEKQRTESL